MSVTSEIVADTVRVGIDGELTIYTVAELAAALLPQMGAAACLELDLSQVTEMDGAGLQLLAVIEREPDRQEPDGHANASTVPQSRLLAGTATVH